MTLLERFKRLFSRQDALEDALLDARAMIDQGYCPVSSYAYLTLADDTHHVMLRDAPVLRQPTLKVDWWPGRQKGPSYFDVSREAPESGLRTYALNCPKGTLLSLLEDPAVAKEFRRLVILRL